MENNLNTPVSLLSLPVIKVAAVATANLRVDSMKVCYQGKKTDSGSSQEGDITISPPKRRSLLSYERLDNFVPVGLHAQVSEDLNKLTVVPNGAKTQIKGAPAVCEKVLKTLPEKGMAPAMWEHACKHRLPTVRLHSSARRENPLLP